MSSLSQQPPSELPQTGARGLSRWRSVGLIVPPDGIGKLLMVENPSILAEFPPEIMEVTPAG